MTLRVTIDQFHLTCFQISCLHLFVSPTPGMVLLPHLIWNLLKLWILWYTIFED